ncbi:MAG TPA: hypothetical protein P5137_02080 [Candidatus Brocadiia bacterium]|nr:hypothetical protein [Candidatus Brocadiia bacterium]
MWRALACWAALAACVTAEAGKPVVAVLPFRSQGDRNKMGQFVRESIHNKLARTYQYIIVEMPDIDSAMKSAGLKLTKDTTPAQVGAFGAEVLQCRLVVWGEVERGAEGWIIFAKGMDLDKSRTELAWDLREPVTGSREAPLACGRIVDEISGFHRQIGEEPVVPEAKRRPAPRKNLVANGGFEAGADAAPAAWHTMNCKSPLDNLTTFWGEEGNPGRCLLVNTDVLEKQALDWRLAIAQGADWRKPPGRRQTTPPKYDTIGGTYGVHVLSDPIPVKRGVVYRITADVKGPSSGIFFPHLFVKGYAAMEATEFAGQDREIYRMYLACRTETNGKEFENFTRTFLPNAFYVVFDLEDKAGGLGAKATELLRRMMTERGFPLIPLEEQKKRLAAAGIVVKHDMPIPEIAVAMRDRLLCGHAIYGKAQTTDKGPQLCLRLTSARIKDRIPLLDQAYAASDDKALAAGVAKFLDAVEKRLPFVATMRVIPYSYWPPAAYSWDNITLVEEGESLW